MICMSGGQDLDSGHLTPLLLELLSDVEHMGGRKRGEGNKIPTCQAKSNTQGGEGSTGGATLVGLSRIHGLVRSQRGKKTREDTREGRKKEIEIE